MDDKEKKQLQIMFNDDKVTLRALLIVLFINGIVKEDELKTWIIRLKQRKEQEKAKLLESLGIQDPKLKKLFEDFII